MIKGRGSSSGLFLLSIVDNLFPEFSYAKYLSGFQLVYYPNELTERLMQGLSYTQGLPGN
jgi:hypothetical protein